MKLRKWTIGSALLLWWIGGYGLVTYGAAADRGPFAFLIDWQTAVFSGSNRLVAGLIGAVLIFWVPGWITRFCVRTWPNNALLAEIDQTLRQSMRSRREVSNVARASWVTLKGEEKIKVLRKFRKWALGIAVAILLGTWGIATYVRDTENAEAGNPLTQVKLQPDHPISLGGASSWVHVTDAKPLLDHVIERDYSLRSTSYRDFYVPLVPPGWKPSMRVYLLEKDEVIPEDQRENAGTYPSGPIEGELWTSGPRNDIAARFNKIGLAVGDWTAILDRRKLHGVIPGEDEFLGFFIWFMGISFSLLSWFGVIVYSWQIRKARSQEESESGFTGIQQSAHRSRHH